MSVSSASKAGKDSLKWLWLSAGIVVFDQITKWLVIQNLYEFQRIFLMPILDLVR